MLRSYDEPFTLYGLLASNIETDPERSWVRFCLEPDATFSTGERVTVEDVEFSMEILRRHGRPNFRSYYKQISSVETTAGDCIRFVFKEPNRELPLLLGLMPVLSRSDWEGKDFTATTFQPPVGSGPYEVTAFDPGETLTLSRRSDYWGARKAITRGLHVIDTVNIVRFNGENALWQAFTSGEIDFRQESDPKRWTNEYTFPAMRAGTALKGEIAHQRPTGMFGFVFNTRREIFKDRRVRQALTLAFNFEWTNATLNQGVLERIESFYGNSELGFTGPAEGRERALLAPFAETLPEGALEGGYAQPLSPVNGRNRANLRAATRLLDAAGWRVVDGRLTKDDTPFVFEILLQSASDEKVANIFARSLERLGIEVTVRTADNSAYQERLTTYDYDIIIHAWWLSLSPGEEQRFYFGSDGVNCEGTRNYMGADHPAIDAMIDAMLEAESVAEYRASVRALDRVLTTGLYVIPLWYAASDWVAWRKPLSKPERSPLYGYRPEVWWIDPEQ
ncbi:UNVERIFIED_CONTAM: hypothetical protein GTU68_065828 [Idotea baltica]|nr:hypothetical protein [Idotea baltica]